MDSTLIGTPDSVGVANTWYTASGTIWFTSSGGTQNNGTAFSYLGFEWVPNDSAHDWIFAASAKSTKPNAFNNNQSIVLAYDYQEGGWWGGGNTHISPTIYFGTSSNNDGTLYERQAFIIWVVENSDYRSRYEGPTWVNPTSVYNGTTGLIGWSMSSDNVVSTLFVQFTIDPTDSTSWEDINIQSPSPYTGSYACTSTGYYRLCWTYSLSGTPHTVYSETFHHVASSSPSGTPPVLISCVDGYTGSNGIGNGRYYVTAVYQTPQPVSVVLRVLKGNYFEEVGALHYDSTSGSWYFNGLAPEGQKFIRATSSDGGYLDTALVVTKPSDDPNFSVFGEMAEYVSDFFRHVGSLFSFLPNELSAFLVTAIMAMVILGIVQLVKP